MNGRDLLRASDLAGTLAAVKDEVRRSPGDAKLRTFLFQLFCVTGEWDRALTQLKVTSELDPLAIPMATTYQAAIRCEMLRARVFAGTRTPTVFGDPEPWMSMLIEANRRLAAGAPDDAARLRDTAFEDAPSATGTIDGTAFEWLADADPRLGPMLEVIVDGRYFWVPFHRLQSLSIEAPADLRDQVWLPAQFVWANGGEAVGFIPARYPGSEAAQDPAIALGRKTEWREQGEWYLGLGQRMLATDGGEHPLLDIRRIDITVPAEAA
jgi:type VI secretion system protein ImpE